MRAVAWAWDRITTYFVPSRLRADLDLERRARLLVLVTLILTGMALFRVAQLASVRQYLQTAIAFAGTFGLLGAARNFTLYVVVSCITALFSLVIGSVFLLGNAALLPAMLGG